MAPRGAARPPQAPSRRRSTPCAKPLPVAPLKRTLLDECEAFVIREVRTGDFWIPGSFTGTSHSPPPLSGKKKETSMTIRREFDLPADEVESDVAQGLMDAGLLEVIEPGDQVFLLAQRFRRTVAAHPGETDEVRDLDIKELADH